MRQLRMPVLLALWLGVRLSGAPDLAPGPVSPDTTLVLSGGNYLDVRAGTLRPNGTIVVRGGKIVEMHARGSTWRPPTGAQVLELNGQTILPGLVDAHVHLTISGIPEDNAAATLKAGFTTVVDLGSVDGAGVRLRDAISERRVTGPRVIVAGSWIGSKGGVCEFGGATVGSAEEARTRARADLDSGADALKVCVTGWPADAIAFPDSVELKAGPLSAVMDVGREAHRPVYAHAIGRAGALLAADAGAMALAHTPVIDSVGAIQLKAAGVYVISTLATLTARPDGDRVRRSFQLLRAAGVPIVFGTDAGVLPHGMNAKEFVALAEAGMSPLEALRAATVTAAALIGVTDVGEIAPGAVGDFVVVSGDPLQDLRVLEGPVLVVKGGRVTPPGSRPPPP